MTHILEADNIVQVKCLQDGTITQRTIKSVSVDLGCTRYPIHVEFTDRDKHYLTCYWLDMKGIDVDQLIEIQVQEHDDW